MELTGWCPHGDWLVNFGPKTPNNMVSICEKKYDLCRFFIFTFLAFRALWRLLEGNGAAEQSWHKLLFLQMICLLNSHNIIQKYPETIQTHPDALQTHSGHTLDTVFLLNYYPLKAAGRNITGSSGSCSTCSSGLIFYLESVFPHIYDDLHDFFHAPHPCQHSWDAQVQTHHNYISIIMI